MKCSKKLMVALFCFLTVPSVWAAKPELIAEGFELPWSIEFVDKKTALVSERAGRIYSLDLNTGKKSEVKGGWPVWFSGQGGLLDLALHPGFEQNGWIYATFSKPNEDGASTALARFKISDLRVTDFQELFVSNAVASGGRHFGSRIVFDEAGYVYISSGDRGERDWAQQLSSHAGKIIRLHDDGRVPEDNPFVGSSEAASEIWAYGNRNPQGMYYDKATGTLWSIEHGPRGGDEINIIKRGANYGWPVISYGKEYWGPVDVGEGTHREGMEQPVKYFVPSIAPSSLALFQGKLYAGALKLRHINVLALDSTGKNIINEQRLFEDLDERVRDVVVGPDAWMYFLTDTGKLYRFEP
jgi:glucose/arabinose dehydrogenase